MFYSESEDIWLILIHSESSYDLKLIVAVFLSGKMKCDIGWGADLEMKLIVIGQLENGNCTLWFPDTVKPVAAVDREFTCKLV